MIEQTREEMYRLKFFGMLETLDQRLHEAQSNGWSYSDLLSTLVVDEKHYRAKRSLTKTEINELRNLKFVTDPRNVLIIGPTGVGKTYLATALGNQACQEGFKVLFMGMNMFIEEVAMARATGKFLSLRKRLITTDLLILDDLGIKELPASATQDLYDILEERYQDKSTIITSQLPITNWSEVITDTVALEAIVDRLIHGALKLEMKGESYRKNRGIEKKS